ncbi:MAG: hypothetical protein SLAVMIC_00944 [uncultured marine phage]|uniref:Uncharacterized protein n=1 Tax=uncultured marine phage TaxID=707152 RepID=A0A8D9FRZ1_9VIRU|nr:MAG: hypothetical protein SLAVMIC_00944 [uncultured marine phage]
MNSDNILKYNNFNESMMVNVPNNDDKNKKSKLDFRKFCSWDEISYKAGMLRFKQMVKVYYSPLGNEVLSIEAQDAFSNVENFPIEKGSKREVVRNMIENDSKYTLVDSHTKKFKNRQR